MKNAHCIGCGCSDESACSDGCFWSRVDYERGKGVCSNCDELIPQWDQEEGPQLQASAPKETSSKRRRRRHRADPQLAFELDQLKLDGVPR